MNDQAEAALLANDLATMLEVQARNVRTLLTDHRMLVRQGPQLETGNVLQAMREHQLACQQAIMQGRQPPQAPPTPEQVRQHKMQQTLLQAKQTAQFVAANSANLNQLLNGTPDDGHPPDETEPCTNGLHLTE